MKKNLNEWRKKPPEDLRKEVKNLREEIAKLKLEIITKPVKDSNLLIKKRKTLARLLTILKENKDAQEVERLGN